MIFKHSVNNKKAYFLGCFFFFASSTSASARIWAIFRKKDKPARLYAGLSFARDQTHNDPDPYDVVAAFLPLQDILRELKALVGYFVAILKAIWFTGIKEPQNFRLFYFFGFEDEVTFA